MFEDRATHPKAEAFKERWAQTRRGSPLLRGHPAGASQRSTMDSGARWKDLPPQDPSPAPFWRRLQQWKATRVSLDLWRRSLGELDKEGIGSWDQTFSDGTFSPAKKGAATSADLRQGRRQRRPAAAAQEAGGRVDLSSSVESPKACAAGWSFAAPLPPLLDARTDRGLARKLPQIGRPIQAQVQHDPGLLESHLLNDYASTLLKPF
jgi:hypothetical protein